MKNKNAFTLVELVLAIILSSIIFLFLMNFISKTFTEISYSKNKTNIISEIYQFGEIVSDLREKYNSGFILKDNLEGTGSDILLIRTGSGETKNEGYIFAMINNENLKIDGSDNVDNIEDKVLAYKKISSYEMGLLSSDIDNSYNFIFNKDKVFKNIKLKDFQLDTYNTGSLIEVKFFINPVYRNKLDGLKYSEIGTSDIEKIVLNF